MKIVGIDIGTGNFVSCTKDEIKIQRDAFLQVDSEKTSKKNLKMMNVPFVEINNKLYIVGNKATELANIFGNAELRRPMRQGTLNPTEADAFPVLRELIKSLLPEKDENEDGFVTYCIPGKPVDKEQEISYHEDVIKQIIESLRYKAKAINEAVALGYVGLSDNSLTGIAISFGAGMANIAIMYQGISALEFSVAKCGDWIDTQVANDCGISKAKAQKIKESGDYSISSKETNRTREQNAIKTYYSALIRYILANIEQQFKSNSMPEFPEAIPIVCGGGTSMVKGFIDVFKEQFTQKGFPIQISEIKLVKEPLTAVAKGCFIDAELENE
jgi:actin-like ATPase involved in cell morphogenesis